MSFAPQPAPKAAGDQLSRIGRFNPLDGVTVLDFSKVLAGPVCTQYLGDLGANVIKIEPRDGGDDTRSWPPFIGQDGAVFMSANKNKRSLAIDLKRPEAMTVLRQLVAKTDIVVESFRTGVAERLSIDYHSLCAVKPDLIYASISGFGRDGPLADLPGYDVMVQAFSGIMSITGEPGGEPVRSAFSPLDQTTGIHTALGILAALRHRDRTGKGQFLETSLFETALAFLGYTAEAYWASGRVPGRSGSGHESLCPYQAFAAVDGYILIAVGNDKQWRAFCPAAGLEDMLEDPRFVTNAARVKHFKETVARVSDVVGRRTVGEWTEALRQAGIPNSPIHTVDQALGQEQAIERGMVVSLHHPQQNSVSAISMPIAFAGYDRSPRSVAPLLGQHSVAILRELGISDKDIQNMIAKGVVTVPATETSVQGGDKLDPMGGG